MSLPEQNVARQLSELRAAGCDNIFSDHGVSGARMVRPALDEALSYLRPGDTLVVQELSRLGRPTEGVLALVRDLEGRAVNLRILGLGIETSTPTGRLVLSILAAVFELERELLRERGRSGLAEARRRGRTGGRPPSLTDDQRRLVVELHESGRSVAEIGRLLSTSERTIRRALAKGEAEQ